jgi:hypothetical protein
MSESCALAYPSDRLRSLKNLNRLEVLGLPCSSRLVDGKPSDPPMRWLYPGLTGHTAWRTSRATNRRSLPKKGVDERTEKGTSALCGQRVQRTVGRRQGWVCKPDLRATMPRQRRRNALRRRLRQRAARNCRNQVVGLREVCASRGR